MKKLTYLLPLVLLGMLSSCREEFEATPQSEFYTRAFIKEFGVIDPQHHWGFDPASNAVASRAGGDEGESGSTPSSDQVIDVNGNEWKNPPLVKDWERKAVMQYLHRNGNVGDVRYSSSFDLGPQYFVTQVGCCHNVYATENCNGDHPYDFSIEINKGLHGTNGTTHGHLIAENGTTEQRSFQQMNFLHVAFKDDYTWEELANSTISHEQINNEDQIVNGGWAHVNNFNKCENTNYGGNTVVIGKAHDFAYKNSLNNAWYDNYIVIPGSLIDYRLSAYHYLCFDYKAVEQSPKTSINVTFTWTDDNGSNNRTEGITVPGAYKDGQPIPDDVIIQALQDKAGKNYGGYSPSTAGSGHGYVWQQVQEADQYVLPDGIYDDWVIRLCGYAIRANSDEIPVYPHEDYKAFRIFVEDLSVAANFDIQSGSSDWDFNDLVFDATPYVKTIGSGVDATSENRIRLTIRALGGTKPIYICKYHNGDNVFDPVEEIGELHGFMGVSSTTMVNTGTGTNVEIKTIDLPASYFGMNFNNTETVSVQIGKENKDVTRICGEEYNKIRIWIKEGANNVEMEMRADQGEAPSKLCVPSYLAAPTERMHIRTPYPNFDNYVQSRNVNFWEAPVSHN